MYGTYLMDMADSIREWAEGTATEVLAKHIDHYVEMAMHDGYELPEFTTVRVTMARVLAKRQDTELWTRLTVGGLA